MSSLNEAVRGWFQTDLETVFGPNTDFGPIVLEPNEIGLDCPRLAVATNPVTIFDMRDKVRQAS